MAVSQTKTMTKMRRKLARKKSFIREKTVSTNQVKLIKRVVIQVLRQTAT